MTTLVVLQPGYLPWLGYFDQLHRADVFVHYDDVQYDKHGWRNRNRVKGLKGPVWLTVPVRHRGRSRQSILEAEIDEPHGWRQKHINTINQLYARAPFVQSVAPQLRSILDRPWAHLVDLNLTIIEWLASELGIKTPCYRASELGIEGERNERLLALCRRFGATTYLSGSAARDYLDLPRFEAEGIEVRWHDYEHPSYAQLHGPFVPYLSVIDLMMNVGADSLKILSRASDHDLQHADKARRREDR